ncbi:unnamed protein product, partial [Amoebophrya sp. A25]
ATVLSNVTLPQLLAFRRGILARFGSFRVAFEALKFRAKKKEDGDGQEGTSSNGDSNSSSNTRRSRGQLVQGSGSSDSEAQEHQAPDEGRTPYIPKENFIAMYEMLVYRKGNSFAHRVAPGSGASPSGVEFDVEPDDSIPVIDKRDNKPDANRGRGGSVSDTKSSSGKNKSSSPSKLQVVKGGASTDVEQQTEEMSRSKNIKNKGSVTGGGGGKGGESDYAASSDEEQDEGSFMVAMESVTELELAREAEAQRQLSTGPTTGPSTGTVVAVTDPDSVESISLRKSWKWHRDKHEDPAAKYLPDHKKRKQTEDAEAVYSYARCLGMRNSFATKAETKHIEGLPYETFLQLMATSAPQTGISAFRKRILLHFGTWTNALR